MERGPLSKDACVKNREFEPTAKVVGTLSEYVMSRMGLAGVLFWALNLGLDLGLDLGLNLGFGSGNWFRSSATWFCIALCWWGRCRLVIVGRSNELNELTSDTSGI